MTAISGCPPTTSACDPNSPLQAVSLPATPASLLTIVEVGVGCAIALLLIAWVYLLLTRSSAVPLWRRKVAVSVFSFALISGAVALFTWMNYLPFTRAGLPADASYAEWLTQLGPVKMGELDTMFNSLTYVTGGIVLGCLVLAAIAVEQAVRRGFRHNVG